MRILRVAQKLYPSVTGGGAYHVHALSRDQARMGHDVTVLTVGDEARRESRYGYTVVECPALASVLGNDFAPAVWRYLRSKKSYDVVHAHSHLYFSTNLAALARWLGEIPLAITNHGLYSQNAPEWLFKAYLVTIGRWTFDAADLLFCYTEADKRRIQALGVDTDVAVVPNGVDTERFTPEGPTSTLIERDQRVVIFVGRLVDGKRPQDAVDAIDNLPSSYDAHLYLVGEGPMRQTLEERVENLCLEDKITFLGHVPYDEMPKIFRSADVLLLPSRAEGLPRTVLEAFASGIPVLSSRLENTAPIVEEAGKTVTIGDTDAYADALLELLEGGVDALGRRGRIVAKEQFTWSKTVEETTEELLRLTQ